MTAHFRALVVAVIPDTDVASCERSTVNLHLQPVLSGCPICVIDFLCGSIPEVLGRTEDDVQILECSAVTPVIPEIDLADGVFVAKVDLRIGRGIRVLCFVLADLDIFCVIFDAICQPRRGTVSAGNILIERDIAACRDII